MRTIIETRQANIEQRTQQIIAFHNTLLLLNDNNRIDTVTVVFASTSFFF
jgi:hypothetical protein